MLVQEYEKPQDVLLQRQKYINKKLFSTINDKPTINQR